MPFFICRIRRFLAYCLLLTGCFLLPCCGTHPLDVDTSKIQVEPIKIRRFERDFFALPAGTVEEGLPALQKKYPGFADLFIKNIVCHSGLQDSACIPAITKFLLDKDMRGSYEATQSVFPDLLDVEAALTDIVKHYAYYFPGKPLPKVYSMMSGYNFSIATLDTNFAIGLEAYLGNGNIFYKMAQIPAYRQFTMQKDFITPDFAKLWLTQDFPNTGKSGTLLNEMIYQGKLLYLMDALMPDTEDTIKIGFTKKQWDWCESHEKDIWGHLIHNKFLYSTEVDIVTKFTGAGPFTTGFVKESPARTGVWIGWRIVRDYMKAYPKTTLEELMKENDPQLILSKSKYKP